MNNDKLHKQLVTGFGNHDVSPAVMAYKMLQESRYVNEQVLGYMVNYIITMASHPVLPMRLAEIHEVCKQLKYSLEDLGLTGEIQSDNPNEYLAV